jgi:class 3 adenylate cyclase/tetratricopeptide (TPR) repeat protein
MSGLLCTACGSDAEYGARFCERCGAQLLQRCSHCGHGLTRTALFCSRCGGSVDVVSQDVSLETVRTDPERRQLTVMFCDLVGSTALSARLDPEDMRTIISSYRKAAAKAVQDHDGFVARYMGDGILAYFGYPKAHERDAEHAVRAGLAIAGVAPTLENAFDETLHVRVGIATGIVVVGDITESGEARERDVVGDTPNLAARLQGIAKPDSVVIAEATRRLIGDLFQLNDLGAQELKGITTETRAFQVVRAHSLESRFKAMRGALTPLVGRDEELKLLLHLWGKAKDGDGQVVLLSGEAGIGKTRLLEVLKERARLQAAACSEFRCSPEHRSTALYPVVQFLQRLMRFHECNSPVERLARLEASLIGYKFCGPEDVSLMANLLSLPVGEKYLSFVGSPALQKRRTLESLVAWLCERAAENPLLAIWEDLHWADPSTLELLGLLIDRLPNVSIMTAFTYRSTFVPPWSTRPPVTELKVNRLDDSDVESMVRALAKLHDLPPLAVKRIVVKTDGVPLFVEELTKMLLETGALRETTMLGARGDLADTDVPSTLQDSLMARLDRLESAKTVAQIGATIGREFAYGLIREVGEYDDPTLERELRRLCDAELLREYGVPPASRYTFRHALIRDAAYNSLLRSRKRLVHRKVAEVLKKREGIDQSPPELLAHHFAEAQLPEIAIDYWQKAGEQAVRRSANSEAVNQLEAGLELLRKLSPSTARDSKELSLQVALGAPLIAVKGFASAEVQAIFIRARELCGVLHATRDLFPVLFRLRSFHLVKGDNETAYDLGKELVELARGVGDPDLLIEAHYALGAAIYYRGDFPSALEEFRRMETFYDADRHSSHAYLYGQEPGMACLAYQACALAYMGQAANGQQKLRAALAIAEKANHPFSLAFSWTFAAWFYSVCGHARRTQSSAQIAIAVSTKYGFPFWRAMATNFLGGALTEQGRPLEALELLLQGINGVRMTGSEQGTVLWLRLLSRTYGALGRYADALRSIDESIAMSESRGDKNFDSASIHRVKGGLLLACRERPADVETAEALFARSLDLGQRQGARLAALSAATCLARLWSARGDTQSAQRILSEQLEGLASAKGAARLPVVQAARAALEALGKPSGGPRDVSPFGNCHKLL